MPRKPVRSVRLSGRISENTAEKEDVDFVQKKLKDMDQATFIREAVRAYRKLDEGNFIEDIIRAIKDLEGTEDEDVNAELEGVKNSITQKLVNDSFL